MAAVSAKQAALHESAIGTDRSFAARQRFRPVTEMLGSVFYVSAAGKEQPPVIVADQAFQARSVVIGNADANDEPMEKPLQAGEPDRSQTIDVEEKRIDEGGIGSKSTFGVDANGQAEVTSVVGQPIEKLGSDTENRADGAAGERPPSEEVRTDPIAAAAKASAEEPSRRDVLSSPSPARETGAKAPVAIQVARIISGANMRAGPNNGQPVLATIPRGSSIEVIKCRHWCEVVFAGQRGWVYKTFIRAPLADSAMLPERTRPRPRKAGSNSGISRRTGTWASVPQRPKPATARLSADQSTRDAQSRSQVSGAPLSISGSRYDQLPFGPIPTDDSSVPVHPNSGAGLLGGGSISTALITNRPRPLLAVRPDGAKVAGAKRIIAEHERCRGGPPGSTRGKAK